MIDIHVRKMQISDITNLAEYWYDSLALKAQSNARMQLAEQAEMRLQSALEDYLNDHQMITLTALIDQVVYGGVVCAIEANHPALLPERVSRMIALILDLHTPQFQRMVVAKLIAHLKNQLITEGVLTLEAQVSTTFAVEEAFWRASGARLTDQLFVLRLKD